MRMPVRTKWMKQTKKWEKWEWRKYTFKNWKGNKNIYIVESLSRMKRSTFHSVPEHLRENICNISNVCYTFSLKRMCISSFFPLYFILPESHPSSVENCSTEDWNNTHYTKVVIQKGKKYTEISVQSEWKKCEGAVVYFVSPYNGSHVSTSVLFILFVLLCRNYRNPCYIHTCRQCMHNKIIIAPSMNVMYGTILIVAHILDNDITIF